MVNLSSVHDIFKFRVLGPLDLEVTNKLRTAKVLGWNLTGPVFFKPELFRFKEKYPHFI